ncbi:MAG: hypothetical protein ACFE0Q_00470 [Anaerolineae bacterium]
MAENTPQWQLIPLHEFKVPSPPLQEQAKRNWRQILNLFQSDDTQHEEVEDRWRRLEKEIIDRYIPTMDVELATENIADQLDLDQPTILVAPPFCGLYEISRQIVKKEDLPVLDAPPRAELFGKQHYELPDTSFAIIGLEQFFIRHSDGYGVVRYILQQAHHRPCLIVCGSWAWAFIQYLRDIPINDYTVRTLQSHADVAYWRERLRKNIEKDILYQGDSILSEDHPAYLRNLISQGHGNWGVIRAMLKQDMRESDDYQHLFVKGDLPVQWSNRRRSMYFLTHNILLHGPLSSDMLRLLHPMIDQVETHLRELQQLDFIHYDNKLWYIQAHAYPRIHSALQDQRFLDDNLLGDPREFREFI